MWIGGLKIGSVFGFGNLSTVIGKTAEITTGLASGVFLDKHINQLIGRQDSLSERLKNNLDTTIISFVMDFIRYIW